MTGQPAGLVFPASVLTSPWFTILAAIVAFNTIIYMGLTLAKLIPWPHQIHPGTVRRWASRAGHDADEEAAVQDIPVPRQPESDDPYEAMRAEVARLDIPQAFGLTGALAMLVVTVEAIVSRLERPTLTISQLLAAVVFLILAQVSGRRRLRVRTMMWLWALACTGLVGLLVIEFEVTADLIPLTFALILMTAFPSMTLAWRPSVVAAAAMLATMLAATLTDPARDTPRLLLAAATAVLVGAILLHLRLTAIDALSDERARSEALASTDPLTQTLTRHGLLTLVPGLTGTAERTGQTICTMYFDIERLAAANEQYGIGYGDDVLKAVAAAIRDRIRVGDLLARWGGDEFLVVGLGGRPDTTQFSLRIHQLVEETGIDLGKWPLSVRIGTAAGDADQTTLEALIAEAEADAMRDRPTRGLAPG